MGVGMRRLSGLDATFLYLETPHNHLHVGATAILDPSTMPGGCSVARLRSRVECRLRTLEPFRRRLVPIPFQLDHPVWIEGGDPDFASHVHSVTAPAPGGARELAQVTAELFGRPLSRDRPLWELAVVEGLDGGRLGLVAKLHHAIIDGVSAVRLLAHVFDSRPEDPAAPGASPSIPAEPVPSDRELLGLALRARLERPARLAQALGPGLRAFGVMAQQWLGESQSGEPAPFTAPRTPFSAPISAARTVAFTSVPLAEAKGLRRATGTTVNDVVLALCSGALRRYLDRLGSLPDQPLVAVVPISLRAGGSGGGAGSNRFSAMLTTLATSLDDPLARLLAIRDGRRAARDDHDRRGEGLLDDLGAVVEPALVGWAARLYSERALADRHRPVHNVAISTIPGPAFPLYLAGARLDALYPLGSVYDGLGLNITVLRYRDRLGFGFLAAPESGTDLWELAGFIGEELDALTERAGGPGG